MKKLDPYSASWWDRTRCIRSEKYLDVLITDCHFTVVFDLIGAGYGLDRLQKSNSPLTSAKAWAKIQKNYEF